MKALDPSWQPLLSKEFEADYMNQLRQFLKQEYAAGKTIYPKKNEYFAALNLTPFEKVKVVVLGQDPYHGPNQAHGLCFSVRHPTKSPPSLVNIYKEIHRDLGIDNRHRGGDLTPWAEQGVLLLNSVLTVESGRAASHSKKGWEIFTDRVIEAINEHRESVVFMLWGSHAQKKASQVDGQRHLVLSCPHPSPLSAHRGFLGCGHFSKANQYLIHHGQVPIDWELPERAESMVEL